MDRSTDPEPARPTRATVAIAWLAAAGGTIALLLVGASAAEGGVYRVAECNPGLGAGHADLVFDRNSDHYVSQASCQEGRGLSVRHAARRSPSGRWGAWTLTAPQGTTLRRVTTKVSAIAADGHVPQLLVGFPGSEPTPFGRPRGNVHTARWRGEGARSFQARLRCERDGGCGEGAGAKLRIRRVFVQLLDAEAPSAELGGPLGGERTQRGTRALETISTDAGSGIRRVFLAVNGKPVGARKLDCALRRRIALRLRPCPASAEPSFELDTAATPFRQGPNSLRVCALDWAPTNDRNRNCATRRVRIDNACPVDEGSTAGTLEAHIAGLRHGRSIAHGRPARLVGRLVDSAGGGVEGAEVCVATRIDVHGAVERVVATPTTEAGGQFEARLEPGPSRQVRVAHWSDSEHVSERYLRLGVRARPGLRLSPHGTLHNGQRLRFTVRLHGPEAAGRRVHLKVRSGSRWLTLRNGSTNAAGRWSGSYRFRATTGAQTYSFRAYVPRQQGYPYQSGRSATRRVRVSG